MCLGTICDVLVVLVVLISIYTYIASATTLCALFTPAKIEKRVIVGGSEGSARSSPLGLLRHRLSYLTLGRQQDDASRSPSIPEIQIVNAIRGLAP
jgi:hypothetical protein